MKVYVVSTSYWIDGDRFGWFAWFFNRCFAEADYRAEVRHRTGREDPFHVRLVQMPIPDSIEPAMFSKYIEDNEHLVEYHPGISLPAIKAHIRCVSESEKE